MSRAKPKAERVITLTANDKLRRSRLRGLAKLLFAMGLVFLAIPFVSSLIPGDPNPSGPSSPWQPLVDLSGLAPGDEMTIPWPGGPVRVLHRTSAQLAALQAQGQPLQDPDSHQSQQPAAARNPWRSIHPAYFVYLALENSRNCSIRSASATHRWPEGFDEACEGARFDLAGRLFTGTGSTAQRNLTVPPHQFTKETQLQLLPLH